MKKKIKYIKIIDLALKKSGNHAAQQQHQQHKINKLLKT